MDRREIEPYDVHFIPEEILGDRGRLRMTSAPGRTEPEALEVDLDRLREEEGAQVLVSLMESEEYEIPGIGGLIDHARAAGLEVLHLPIPDGGTPAYAGLEERHRQMVDEDSPVPRKRQYSGNPLPGGMGAWGHGAHWARCGHGARRARTSGG